MANQESLTPDQKQKETIRLSISEAARLFGVSEQSIRRAIKDNEITYIVVAGRYKVTFESMVKWSQTTTLRRQRLEDAGIGQYVSRWKISNRLYSPNPKRVRRTDANDKPSVA